MLNDYLTERLEPTGIGFAEFQELCLRLLNHSIICRDESQVEQQLYDRYLRTDELVEDYLGVVGIRVRHNRRFGYVRLYPPGARIPGMDDAPEQSFAGGLRARLRQDEVALVLVLRQLYDKALREGQIDDDGFVTEPMEAIGIAMRNQLGRSLPEKTTERKRTFDRLRKLRLIRYQPDQDLDNGEAGLKIHPMIVDFVSPEALDTLNEALPPLDNDGDAADAP